MEKGMTIGNLHRQLLKEKRKENCPVRKYKLLWLLLALVILVTGVLAWLPRARFDSIIIHHSASQVDNYESIRKYHKKRGMGDAAYHLIMSNGSTRVPLGNLEATRRYTAMSHALGTRSVRHNLTGLHICIVGNYETGPVPQELTPAIGHAIKGLQDKFGIPDNKVLFHRDVGETKCPGRYFTKPKLKEWMATGAEACRPSIAMQQDRIIASAGFSMGTAPVKAVVILFWVLVFFSLGWIAVVHAWSIRKQARKMAESKACHPLLVGLDVSRFGG